MTSIGPPNEQPPDTALAALLSANGSALSSGGRSIKVGTAVLLDLPGILVIMTDTNYEARMTVDRRYYTPREVADLLRVSPTTVMKMVHERRLFAVHVSERIYRIPIGAVTRLLAGDERTYTPTEISVDVLAPVGESVGEAERHSVGV